MGFDMETINGTGPTVPVGYNALEKFYTFLKEIRNISRRRLIILKNFD